MPFIAIPRFDFQCLSAGKATHAEDQFSSAILILGRALTLLREIMGYPWRLSANLEIKNSLLNLLVRNGEPFVLPQVFEPGFNKELFQIFAGSGGIDKKAPLKCAITSPYGLHFLHLGYELLNALGVNLIFHGNEHRCIIRRWIGRNIGHRPFSGWL